MASSMKSFILLILSFISIAVAYVDTACHYDNCLRAVAGTRQGPGQVSTASSDCSSFLQRTITPPATTVTVTTTTTKPPSGTNNQKRGALATIPAYASPCAGAADYSSACSCFGVTPVVTTAPTPVSHHSPSLLNITNQSKDNHFNRHHHRYSFTNQLSLRRTHLQSRHRILQQQRNLLLLRRHQLH